MFDWLDFPCRLLASCLGRSTCQEVWCFLTQGLIFIQHWDWEPIHLLRVQNLVHLHVFSILAGNSPLHMIWSCPSDSTEWNLLRWSGMLTKLASDVSKTLVSVIKGWCDECHVYTLYLYTEEAVGCPWMYHKENSWQSVSGALFQGRPHGGLQHAAANRTKRARAIKEIVRKVPWKGTWTVITDRLLNTTLSDCPKCSLSSTCWDRQQLSLYTKTACGLNSHHINPWWRRQRQSL